MEKVLFRSPLSPGDIIMLTAAVRDLHKRHPNRFITGVDTFFPDIWENNPFITKYKDADEQDLNILEVHYPLVHTSNYSGIHFINGYILYINEKLKLNIFPSALKGDIYISDIEKTLPSKVQQVTGSDKPFWIINAGGKFDFTVKWWDPERYQKVVNHFKNKIQFVQIGHGEHNHKPLDNVVNLIGQTSMRDLILLTYHSVGVLCPITCAMHLAAAVESKHGLINRPCVVVAGGREPPSWIAYPAHQFIHRVGALDCCAHGGCWMSKTVPIEGAPSDDGRICKRVVNGNLPRCMDMITVDEVVHAIETYYDGGILVYD